MQDYTKNLDFLSYQAKLGVGQRFCPSCSMLNPAAQTQDRFCIGCGTALKSDQKFCTDCSTKN